MIAPTKLVWPVDRHGCTLRDNGKGQTMIAGSKPGTRVVRNRWGRVGLYRIGDIRGDGVELELLRDLTGKA
ncbi:MAG: hypothetical protein KC457_01000 [Myxococcales bacterium]|nr:hypothetical protein [Myxococcales bacterium]